MKKMSKIKVWGQQKQMQKMGGKKEDIREGVKETVDTGHEKSALVRIVVCCITVSQS